MRRALSLVALAIAAALPVMGSVLHAQQETPPPLVPGKQVGFAFEPASDGVKIILIAPGSPAERAGLKVGMMVTRLNGIPLGGLDMTRLRELFIASPDEMTLVVEGMGWIKLRREPIPPQ
jgi:predicted metalloprotease with PDZ domain